MAKNFTFSTGVLAYTTHSITIDVNDSTVNNLSSTISFHIDGNVPVPTSITNDYTTTWTNDSTWTVSSSGTSAFNGFGWCDYPAAMETAGSGIVI